MWAVVTVRCGGWAASCAGASGAAGAEPGQRDRTIAAAVDGVGLVLVPILSVWLIGKLLAATAPPAPIDVLVPDLIDRRDHLPAGGRAHRHGAVAAPAGLAGAAVHRPRAPSELSRRCAA